MDLQTLKKQIEDAKFPKETADAVNNIIGMAITRGGELNDDEKQEILDLIDDAIIKNEEESRKLLDVVDIIQGVEDAFVESVEEEYNLELEEKNKKQPAPAVQPVPPTNPNPSP